MTDILVVGLAVADFLFEVTELPDRAEKYVAENAAVVGGGGAANAAVAIAKLGANAKLAARTGDDVIAKLIVDELELAQVDCSMVQRTSNACSSFSSVLVDSRGERQIVNFRGRNLSDNADMLRRVTVDAVLADTRWVKGTVTAMQRAKQLGVPGVLDAEAPIAAETMAFASHIAFSRQGLIDFTGDTDLRSALLSVSAQYQAWMCVTDGQNGVLYVHNKEIRHEPVTRIDVVDTLGAGDVWHGAFTYSLGLGDHELQAVRFANAAATLKCTRAGGGRESPSLQEVESFMRSRLS